jgi:hypothetical protein
MQMIKIVFESKVLSKLVLDLDEDKNENKKSTENK